MEIFLSDTMAKAMHHAMASLKDRPLPPHTSVAFRELAVGWRLAASAVETWKMGFAARALHLPEWAAYDKAVNAIGRMLDGPQQSDEGLFGLCDFLAGAHC